MGRIIDYTLTSSYFFSDFAPNFLSNFLPTFTLIFFDMLEIYWISVTPSSFWNYFFASYYTSGFFLETLSYKNFIVLISLAQTPSVFSAFSQITLDFVSLSFFLFKTPTFIVTELPINFFFSIFSIFDYIFYFAIALFFYIKWYFDYMLIMENNRSSIVLFYENMIYSWANFVTLKFESFDEALCVIVIWPWCLFLVFTHLFSIDNNESFFIFIEWGLPVIYGYFLLIEHIWNFGQYILVYLNGAIGRRSFIITLVEDLIAMIILLSRVTLQIVRGVICGFFHDFFRELSEYLFDVWFVYYETISRSSTNVFFIEKDIVLFLIDLYIVAFTLLFIYAILFLQLLFLVIAVWIFCRCWFISVGPTNKIKLKNRVKHFNKTQYKLFI